MARPIRVEYEGAVYHIYARGNERGTIFRDNDDRRIFIQTLAESVRQHGLVVHAYCLMPNHYHLAVETPRANLSQSIGWIQVTYTIRFNTRHNRSGHLFQGRYTAQVVDADEYAQELVRYIHLNPVRPENKFRIIPYNRREQLLTYPWSSHPAYLGKVKCPDWLNLSWLGYWGKTQAVARENYEKFIGSYFDEKHGNQWNPEGAGLILGREIFKERIKGLIANRKGQEEIHWISGINREEMQKRIQYLLKDEQDKKMCIWVRVRIGGERLSDVGRLFGYKDGSGVLQLVKRLESAAQKDRALAEKMENFRRRARSVKSQELTP
ncbi:MAG TPA: transposase [bacterium]|nr:transposase [bacterium]